jgi:hypothetical protein
VCSEKLYYATRGEKLQPRDGVRKSNMATGTPFEAMEFAAGCGTYSSRPHLIGGRGV